MARESTRIDISAYPELSQLVEQVRRSGRPRILHRGNAVVAILSPVRSRRRVSSRFIAESDHAAALASTFGAWRGLVEPDRLKQELMEAQSDDRPIART